jgi:lambda repressor-like predicted transcriptional regulator
LSFWLGYLDTCRELSQQAGVSLRTLDKALWQHSKERSRLDA